MTAVGIILVVVGVIFMIGSFLVTEKLSQKEITQISELSSIEMKQILKKNMETAEKTVEKMVEEVVGHSIETADHAMRKETNIKIHDISEYAESVVESIHKSHEEVLFLYSMLNDKHTDVENSVAKLEKLKRELQNLENDIIVNIADSTEGLEKTLEQVAVPQPVEEEVSANQEILFFEQESEILNKNQSILELYNQGMDVVNIAKRLGRGVGETKLVIDLYKEGKA